METTVERKRASFQLRTDLLDKLREAAGRRNTSVNRYVETVLWEAMTHQPNDETLEALAEARAGRYAGQLDVTDYNAFVKSLGNIE